MNLILAFLISFSAFTYLLITSSLSLSHFINTPGLVIVSSGTLAAFIISIGLNKVPSYLKSLIEMNLKKDHSYRDIKLFSEAYYSGEELPGSKEPLIKRGSKLLSVGLEQQEIDELLLESHQNEYDKRMELAFFLNNLSKYPPALGMIGTVFSMIGVFAGMSAQDDFSKIGVHIATAMLSTLYGLLLANYFISPLAERITHQTQQWQIGQLAILKTFSNIAAKKSRTFTEENLEIYEKSA